MRHGEVEHHEREFSRRGAEQLDPRAPVVRELRGEAERLEHARGGDAHGLLVIDHEREARAVPGIGRDGFGGLHVGGAFGAGQQDFESRAPARLAEDFERALVPADDAEHGGQAEPAPGEFRGEKRIENPRLHFGRHAAAVVRDFEAEVVALRQVRGEKGAREILAVGAGEAGGEADEAAFFAHGLGGVDDQIHHHLAELRGVAEHRGQGVGEAEFQHRAFADRDLEQPRGFHDERVEVEPLDDEAALARIGEHLFAKVGGAFGGGLDLLEERLHRRFRGQVHAGEAGVAEHAAEQVVEIVGDAAGEHAETFELLRFLELALDDLALGGGLARGLLGDDALAHVLHQREDGDAAARGVEQHGILPQAMHGEAALGEVAVVRDVAPVAPVEEPLDGEVDFLRILGMHERELAEVPADDFPGLPAKHVFRLPGPAGDAKIRLPFDDRERRIFDVVDEPQLRLLELRGGLLHLGDVARDADEPDDLPGLVAHGKFRGQEPALASVRRGKRLLAVDGRLAGRDHLHVVRMVKLGDLPATRQFEHGFADAREFGPSVEGVVGFVLQQVAALAVFAKNRVGHGIEQRADEQALAGRRGRIGGRERGFFRGCGGVEFGQREERAPDVARAVDQRQRGGGAVGLGAVFGDKGVRPAPASVAQHGGADGRPERGRVLGAVHERGRLAERLRAAPAKHLHRAVVPVADGAVGRDHEHGVADVVEDERAAQQRVEPLDVEMDVGVKLAQGRRFWHRYGCLASASLAVRYVRICPVPRRTYL